MTPLSKEERDGKGIDEPLGLLHSATLKLSSIELAQAHEDIQNYVLRALHTIDVMEQERDAWKQQHDDVFGLWQMDVKANHKLEQRQARLVEALSEIQLNDKGMTIAHRIATAALREIGEKPAQKQAWKPSDPVWPPPENNSDAEGEA